MRVESEPRITRVGARNATFQHWETLLRNRTKRHRAGEFLVQGVRPITMALQHDWSVNALIRPSGVRPSQWAQQAWTGTAGALFELEPELFAELSDKDDGQSELLAVLAMPRDDLSRVAPAPHSPRCSSSIGRVVRATSGRCCARSMLSEARGWL